MLSTFVSSIAPHRGALSIAGRMVGTHAARYLSSSAASNKSKPHLIVALGGNALLRRGQDMTMANQRTNIAEGIKSLEPVLRNNKESIVHGNGPQSGLLMLESAAYEKETGTEQIPLDVIDAETEGMIGYLIEEAMPDLGGDRGIVTVLSQIEVDLTDPAFQDPTKFVGPVYTKEEAEKLPFQIKPDGKYFRRVVPSPMPVRMMPNEMKAIQLLTANDNIVICAGGGGIPVVKDPETGRYKGVEAVIDKDRAACMLGKQLKADGLLILTDVPGIATDYNTNEEKWISRISSRRLKGMVNDFPNGSMRPKVQSCIDFVESSTSAEEGKEAAWAAVGSLQDAAAIVEGKAGTRIEANIGDEIEYYSEPDLPKVA